jgi:hypothetical protein
MTAPEEQVGETPTNGTIEDGEAILRLENYTKAPSLVVFALDPRTAEVRLELQQRQRVRVVNRTIYRTKGTSISVDSHGSPVRVFMTKGIPIEGLLGLREEVVGLPGPCGGKRYVVDLEVVYALHRGGIHRSDLLTPGRARYDPATRKLLGFEGVNAVEFAGASGRVD